MDEDHSDGFLIPPWFKYEVPVDSITRITNVVWGVTLGTALFTGAKAFSQSWNCYKRGKLRNAYIIMIWAEWLVSISMSVLGWMDVDYSDTYVRPGFWLYFAFMVLWIVQIQCILQIMINRVRLLMDGQRKANYLKWGVAILVGLINISVFIIWIPAQLQISQGWITANKYWDRTEKCLFAVIDISLNVYFMYLVRSKLIANGLKKYEKLFWFNLTMVVISLSLDILIIGAMSLPSSAIYLQFQPLAYLLKLYIEMNISELIVKIVKAENQLNEHASQWGNMQFSPRPSATAGICSPVQPQTSVHEVLMEGPTVDKNCGGNMVSVQTLFDRAPSMEEGLGGPSRNYDDKDGNGEKRRSTLDTVTTAETRSSEGDSESEISSRTGLRKAVT